MMVCDDLIAAHGDWRPNIDKIKFFAILN